MPRITSIEPGFYRIPLPTVLTDSMHGEMRAFELNTVRMRDADGAEGVGYTFTVGRNGGAIDDILAREMPEIVAGEEADQIERLWHKAWWALHYGGRGGPTVLAISAFDMALWDLKAKRADLPLWKAPRRLRSQGALLCRRHRPRPARSTSSCARRTTISRKGFRAIKMKVGRANLSEDVERVQAMREHLGDGFPLMADANMKWSVDGAIRAARAFSPTTSPGSRSRPSPTIRRVMPASCARAACRSRRARTCARSGSSSSTWPAAASPIRSPTSPIAAASRRS